MKRKRILSLITALALMLNVFTALGTSAYALPTTGESDPEVLYGPNANDLDGKGDFFEVLSMYANSIGYVKLNKDIELTSDFSSGDYTGWIDKSISIPLGTFTLNLNGHSITANNYIFDIHETAVVTITDTSEEKTGSMTVTEGTYSLMTVHNGGKVIIEDGSYKSGNGSAVYVYDDGIVEIKGGTFESTKNTSLYNSGGKLTISGGTFKASDSAAEIACSASETDDGEALPGETIITGGTFESSSQYGVVDYNGGKIDISKYSDPNMISFHNGTWDLEANSKSEVPIGKDTIVLPEDYAFTTDYSFYQKDYLAKTDSLQHPVEKVYTATRVVADGIENTETPDAVGYYVENVPAAKLSELKWYIFSHNGQIPAHLMRDINLGASVESSGNVSFGIVIYGKHTNSILGDFEVGTSGTSENSIFVVYVGK